MKKNVNGPAHCGAGVRGASYSRRRRRQIAFSVAPADPVGHTDPALLTQFSYEADPTGPTASIIWAGPETRRVDPTHSHPYSSLILGLMHGEKA